MKKRVSLLMLTATLSLSGIHVQAAEDQTSGIIHKYLDFFAGEITGNKENDGLFSLMDSAEELLKNVEPEEAEKVIAFIEEQIQEGRWESEEGIKEAIARGEKEFGVELTEEQKDQVMSVIAKIKKMGISPEFILEQAKKIYEKYGGELKDKADEAGKEILSDTQDKIKEEVKKSFTDYFSDMVNSVKTFFRGMFGR